MFIGGNDICAYCKDSVSAFSSHILRLKPSFRVILTPDYFYDVNNRISD